MSVRPSVRVSEDQLQFLQANHKMSLVKVVPYVLWVTKMPSGQPGGLRKYPRSGYFLVTTIIIINIVINIKNQYQYYYHYYYYYYDYYYYFTIIIRIIMIIITISIIIIIILLLFSLSLSLLLLLSSLLLSILSLLLITNHIQRFQRLKKLLKSNDGLQSHQQTNTAVSTRRQAGLTVQVGW